VTYRAATEVHGMTGAGTPSASLRPWDLFFFCEVFVSYAIPEPDKVVFLCSEFVS
jgi:hypothetical protein